MSEPKDEYNLAKTQRRRQIKARETKHRYSGGKTVGDLSGVFRDTVIVCSELFSSVSVSPAVKLDVSFPLISAPPLDSVGDCKVEVLDMDAVEMIRMYCADTNLKSPMLLNLASDMYPGGGVNSGKKAQEECIFRRTNAFMTHPLDWYPLKPEELIYSPEIFAVKDLEHKLLPATQRCKFGMLTVAALRKPKLDRSGTKYNNDDDRMLMTAKIDTLFRVAIMKGHDSLVLGALGCGVFRNPNKEVASIFHNCIQTYRKYFKRIGFAILVVKPIDKENLTVFANTVTK